MTAGFFKDYTGRVDVNNIMVSNKNCIKKLGLLSYFVLIKALYPRGSSALCFFFAITIVTYFNMILSHIIKDDVFYFIQENFTYIIQLGLFLLSHEKFSGYIKTGSITQSERKSNKINYFISSFTFFFLQ